MRVGVVTNLAEEKGLARDCEILCGLLRDLGHAPSAIQFDKLGEPRETFDLMIHLEVRVPRLFPAAPRHWLVPNPEWWQQGWDLRPYERVLCKTQHAFALFAPRCRAELTGFMSQDLYDATVPRRRAFLHVAGASILRHTRQVIEAWRRFGVDQELTVLSHVLRPPSDLPANVRFIGHRIAPAAYAALVNAHLFHVCTGAAEGWSHSQHEALGCSGVVLATDSGPMNEAAPEDLLIASRPGDRMGLATAAVVTPESIAHAVVHAAELRDIEVDALRSEARQRFLEERAAFARRFAQLVGQV